MAEQKHAWSLRNAPDRLERRYEFPDYANTRAFLENVGKLSERTGIYPDLSFGRTYVNATLALDPAEAVCAHEAIEAFAAALDALIATQSDYLSNKV